MIVNLLMNVVYSVFAALTSVLKVPSMPQEVIDVVGTVFDYMSDGMSIVGNFVHLPYLLTLFSLVVMFDTFLYVYHFVLWLLKKIPLLNIK